MAKTYVERDYKIHILDIRDLVDYFENTIEYLISGYILSRNDINTLFDYCIHMSFANVSKYNLNFNGSRIQSNFIDNDLFDSIYKDILGETFINTLYYKLKTYNILVNDPYISLGRNRTNGSRIIKLTVVGNSLWVFEGVMQ